MIKLKSAAQIDLMRTAGKITAGALSYAGQIISEGMTYAELDHEIKKFITDRGAVPTFLNYNGFPASACISVNEEVIHGIPDGRKFKEGDIVSIDVGAYIGGYTGDAANTFGVGRISDEAQRLIDVTKQSFFDGIAKIGPGARIGDISNAIQNTVEHAGFSVIREYVGHGVGRDLHEEPDVPNYGPAGRGPRLYNGMTIAVEPMVCAGRNEIRVLDNGWTVVTCDGSLAAHYENTIAIVDNKVEILTKV
ncbi:MAG: type I methionyl aminopeptidase [Firmicutes bacterium]|nr:type I methionyl aminopeptidase [Bacillota bacterium]